MAVVQKYTYKQASAKLASFVKEASQGKALRFMVGGNLVELRVPGRMKKAQGSEAEKGHAGSAGTAKSKAVKKGHPTGNYGATTAQLDRFSHVVRKKIESARKEGRLKSFNGDIEALLDG